VPPVKKRRPKSDAAVAVRPVKKKARREKPEWEEAIVRIVKGEPQYKRQVPFRDLKMLIADTLERVMEFEGDDRRANAEESAQWIAYSIVYEDGGFKVREAGYDLPHCDGCK
jgi:hypothetical protein